MVGKKVFRVVIFRGRSQLVAQCLEVDIAAQARTYDELLERLRRAFEAEIVLSKERNVEPFQLLPPAPKKFFFLWEGSEELSEKEPWLAIHPLVAITEPRTATGQRA